MTDFIKNGQNPKKNTNKEYDQFDDLNIHGQLSPDSNTLKKMLGYNNSKFQEVRDDKNLNGNFNIDNAQAIHDTEFQQIKLEQVGGKHRNSVPFKNKIQGIQIDKDNLKVPPAVATVDLNEERKIVFNDNLKNQKQNFTTNHIRTAKYNIITFIPVGLLVQFLRFSNCYFLLVTALQCIPTISPLTPVTAINPMVFVLIVSLIREGYEDYQRYKFDQQQNSQGVKVVVKNQIQEIKSSDLKVGMVVLMEEGETFPADLCLLCSSNEGLAFIKTSSLDGEKNLKKRQQPKDFQNIIKNNDKKTSILNIMNLFGSIQCENPNKDLHSFKGLMSAYNDEYTLSDKQLLLRGAQLQNTEWVLSICVYTGFDTKIMMNSQKGRQKLSHLETMVNKLVLITCIIQSILCILMAAGTFIWQQNNLYWNIQMIQREYSDKITSLISFFTYFLLLCTMLPISLLVSWDVCKVVQSFFIMQDVQMYSWEREQLVMSQTANIVEDLGQVGYIFSDKTGTLTRNVMEFKYMLIGQEFYGDQQQFEQQQCEDLKENNDDPQQQSQNSTNLGSDNATSIWKCKNYDKVTENINNQTINFKINSKGGNASLNLQTQRDQITEFMKVLSLAHMCVTEVFSDKNGNVTKFYNGPSPDEVALVDYACQMKFECIESTDELIKMQMSIDHKKDQKSQQLYHFEVLRKMEFNSDRKRMSVLLKDPIDGKLKLFIKGADSIIKDRLDKKQLSLSAEHKTEWFLDTASKQGLRTLLMGMKVVEQQEADEFLSQCKDAEKDLKNRDILLDQVYDKFERDIVLLGATAVEDRLQDDVPQTINSLQKAGIKIWMLTGDKLETAENIGESCKLINSREMLIHKLSTVKDVEAFCCIENLNDNSKRAHLGEQRAVLVEASALSIITNNKNKKSFFVAIAKTCEAVICCRVSPSQKADVVRMIKEDDPEVVTLAIGDGANDVSMIREAHIGVGLYGNEGMSAVQSSDFALGEFKFLWRLLMHHGRLCYLRNAELILYFFYKNLVLTAPHVFYAFYNGFSGQTIYDDYYISFYNLFFTSWPLVIKAVFEQDISYQMEGNQLKKFYQNLYYMGEKKLIFTWRNYMIEVFYGVCHSVVVFFLPLYIFNSSQILGQTGLNVDMWIISLTSFTCLYTAVTGRIIVWTRWWTQITFIFYSLLSICVYIAYVWFSDIWWVSLVQYTVVELHRTPLFWLVLLLIGGLLFCGDLMIEYWRFNYSANGSDYVRLYLTQKTKNTYLDQDQLRNVAISDDDAKNIHDFMDPIQSYYREQDYQRQQNLNQFKLNDQETNTI